MGKSRDKFTMGKFRCNVRILSSYECVARHDNSAGILISAFGNFCDNPFAFFFPHD